MTPDLNMPMEKRAEIARMNAERDQSSGKIQGKLTIEELYRTSFGTGIPSK
jgi:hypothetical protein